MFGISTWKWIAALIGFGFIADLGIPGLSLVAEIPMMIAGVVVLLIFIRWLFSSRGISTEGTAGHDRALRHYYKNF
jgi:biotin transporter BioY